MHRRARLHAGHAPQRDSLPGALRVPACLHIAPAGGNARGPGGAQHCAVAMTRGVASVVWVQVWARLTTHPRALCSIVGRVLTERYARGREGYLVTSRELAGKSRGTSPLPR